jgi:hypothetical protein
MKSEILKHDYARQIGAALELIRQAQSNRGMRVPAPETFDLYCHCAIKDKPYTLCFVRQPSGLLRFRESVKGKPSSLPNNARAGGFGWTLRLDYFENGPTPCAWCGDGSFHHCAKYCGALVCGGRMKGDTFHCRKSCGASWVGVPLREVRGSIAPEVASRRPSLPPAPSKPVLLLRAGGPLPARRK